MTQPKPSLPAELARMTALFQLRAIAAAMGVPALIVMTEDGVQMRVEVGR